MLTGNCQNKEHECVALFWDHYATYSNSIREEYGSALLTILIIQQILIANLDIKISKTHYSELYQMPPKETKYYRSNVITMYSLLLQCLI